jgi:hypothetical protein
MVALKTTTVPSATSSVTLDLTGITGYTDLMVVVGNFTGTSSNTFYCEFGNSGTIDVGNNYSSTIMTGNGSTALSARTTSVKGIFLGSNYAGVSSTEPQTAIFQVMNYANTTTYKTTLARWNQAGGEIDATVGLWRSTNAITSMTFYVGTSATPYTSATGNINSGTTFTVYGIANADIGAYATGGVITQDANYYYHAFGNSSYFTPTRNLTADILVVAGGGGGGSRSGLYGGGGGAGGLVYTASQSLANGTSYTCTVGSGGAGGTNANGSQGNNSNLTGGSLSLTAAVGGGYGSGTAANGGSGGSGGGASRGYSGGSPTSGQGYAGGNSSSSGAGAGGGGAGAAGTSGDTSPTIGGAGVSTYNSWLQATGLGVVNPADNLRYIAGGGSGCDANNILVPGGLGGGGTGAGWSAVTSAGNGVANTGGGGGGTVGGYTVGNGGSGLIIVRYAK